MSGLAMGGCGDGWIGDGWMWRWVDMANDGLDCVQ